MSSDRNSKINYGGTRKDGGHDNRTTRKEDWSHSKRKNHDERIRRRREGR